LSFPHRLSEATDFRMDVGRATEGRTFVRICHIPTGRSKQQIGLNGQSFAAIAERLGNELVAELQAEGVPLSDEIQHILTSKSRSQ
jgi:hypothetical protein